MGFGVLLCLVSIPHGIALGWAEFCRVFQVGSQPNPIGSTGRFWSLGSSVCAVKSEGRTLSEAGTLHVSNLKAAAPPLGNSPPKVSWKTKVGRNDVGKDLPGV